MSDKITGSFQAPDRLAQYAENNKAWRSQLITNTSMLSDEDRQLVEKCINKEWSNPKYKLNWFVGNAQITPFAKLRQWLLEIKSREETIEQLEYEIAKWEIEIERQEYNVKNAVNEFDKKLAEVELKNVKKNNIKSHRRLNDWYLERQNLIDLVNEFMSTEEAKLPDGSGRTYLDVLNTEAENLYEAEYWTNRLGKQAATDLLFYGRIGTGNMDAILSMNPEQQTETLTLAINYASNLQQIQNSIQLSVDKKLGITSNTDNSSLTLPKTAQEIMTKQALPVNGDDLDVYSS